MVDQIPKVQHGLLQYLHLFGEFIAKFFLYC